MQDSNSDQVYIRLYRERVLWLCPFLALVSSRQGASAGAISHVKYFELSECVVFFAIYELVLVLAKIVSWPAPLFNSRHRGGQKNKQKEGDNSYEKREGRRRDNKNNCAASKSSATWRTLLQTKGGR
uniref:Uncharacterized protein n=1 Tax=Gasterosteus aculeatus TaxID=69293 RepID=G3NFW6_GASAC